MYMPESCRASSSWKEGKKLSSKRVALQKYVLHLHHCRLNMTWVLLFNFKSFTTLTVKEMCKSHQNKSHSTDHYITPNMHVVLNNAAAHKVFPVYNLLP